MGRNHQLVFNYEPKKGLASLLIARLPNLE